MLNRKFEVFVGVVLKLFENFEILVVEDIFFLCRFVVVMLQKFGVIIYEVGNGQEVVDVV